MHLPGSSRKGDVLIGIIIALGIFVILSQAVMVLAFSAYDLISYTRARVSARNIAIEEIETIRNAPYDKVGTIGGIPTGIFEQQRVVNRNGQNYTIRTRVVYIDDQFDGVSPIDTLPTDYKRARVDVSWGGIGESGFSEITLVTDIAPRGIETMVGGGTLSILVFDSNGQPVPQAEVQISASTNPPINTSYFTSDTGRVTIPGSPVCNSCYQISVTKNGYSTDKTYSQTEITNPIKPPASVLEAQLTEISFAIDRFSGLVVQTVTPSSEGFSILPNQIIRIRGEKTIGTDGLDDPVYKFDQEIVTDSEGRLSIDQLEWDNYHVSLPSDSTMEIAGIYPITPFSIIPNTSNNLAISLVSDSGSSYLARFEDAGGVLIASVAATLKDDTGFEASGSSGASGSPNFGQIFFDNLENKTYSLIATAEGFLELITNVAVNGDVSEKILLTPQ